MPIEITCVNENDVIEKMEKKTEIVGVRMTPHMKKMVEAICTDLGSDPQEWIRGLIIRELQQWKKRLGRPRLEIEERERE